MLASRRQHHPILALRPCPHPPPAGHITSNRQLEVRQGFRHRLTEPWSMTNLEGLQVKPITLSPFLSAWYTHSGTSQSRRLQRRQSSSYKTGWRTTHHVLDTRELERQKTWADVAIKKRVEAETKHIDTVCEIYLGSSENGTMSLRDDIDKATVSLLM
jgi:hypothetical protein